ncbi:hypothetical protein pdam_00015601 [Pocillopora damicornis]|uniref:Flavin-containing monooxygenase n=1 Tax=Pocillopora damicornis TaxID=46731 RepID=A0A3M6TWZ2_POCDA|nr:hypothetical protein pdam_00015601 [Pocillopora damicornis]
MKEIKYGIDQFGEPVHGSMYKGLWSNSPKEVNEFPDYTFEEHYKKPIPSFPPREVLYDYLKVRSLTMTAFLFNLQSGRWTKGDFRHLIHFNHVVRQVTYNDNTDDFSVVVKSLVEDKDLPVQKFDYLIVATGHFSVPSVPSFPGIQEFPGRVMHSHDFRNAYQFQGQTILIAGIREFKARGGARCEIAIMNGTRESAIFSGNNHLNEPRIGMSVDENL